MEKPLVKLLAIMVWLSLIGIPAVASADDAKVYSGSECTPVSPVFGGFRVLYETGAIVNTAGDANNVVAVDCPIVRDNTQNRNGVKLVEIRVKVTSDILHCKLQSLKPAGEVVQFTDVFSVRDIPDVQFLQMRLDTSEVFGNYQLACELPGGSRIINYVVIEP